MKKDNKVVRFCKENQALIGFVAGVAVHTAVSILVTRGLNKGSMTFTKVHNSEFPVEMPLAQIKEAVKDREGVILKDALLMIKDGVTTMFVRAPV